MKISVITVVYNGVAHIEETIKSVLNQKYSDTEYIIIDGGSTDGTKQVIEKYESKLAYWVSEKDSGIYNAMNKGWKKATGDVIAILNADDYYLPETLSKVAEAFDSKSTDIVYGNITKLRQIGADKFFRDELPDINKMEQTMGIFHPSTFVKRHIYESLDGYNEKYKLSSDYDFLLRAYQKNYQFLYLNESLTVFRIGGVSNTNCNSYKEGYEILKEHSPKHADAMLGAWKRCIKKRRYKGFVLNVAKVFGMQFLIDRKLKKKWSK